jgi:hypothetical protein
MESLIDPKLLVRFVEEDRPRVESQMVSTGLKVTLERFIDSGHTQAIVARVLVHRDGVRLPQRCVLKYEPHSPWSAGETRNVGLALDECPEGFAEHLVPLLIDPVPLPSGGALLLQTIAGDSIDYVRPLDSIGQSEEVPSYINTVIASILTEWNDSPALESRTLGQIVERELGFRI